MVSVLEGEDQNKSADFVVKDIQLIRAEVNTFLCRFHDIFLVWCVIIVYVWKCFSLTSTYFLWLVLARLFGWISKSFESYLPLKALKVLPWRRNFTRKSYFKVVSILGSKPFESFNCLGLNSCVLIWCVINAFLFLWQVKLVKCIVQNIVVDISFNQIGGLCTLCFLELVNFSLNSFVSSGIIIELLPSNIDYFILERIYLINLCTGGSLIDVVI